MHNDAISERGFTLIELLFSLAIAALLASALTGLVNTALETNSDTGTRNDALRDSRFAMQRMVTAVLGTERLLLPLADNPNTDWHENLREQTSPPSLPEGSSTAATAVLAVTLDPTLDVDRDGFMDADNDRDGLVDEDLASNSTSDDSAGIKDIDDDGDGVVDESPATGRDDDEDGLADEDWIDGIDNDGDGAVDEDFPADINFDNQPGIAGFDDDGDGTIDEGDVEDDDEDGTKNEDWLDPVVFFLSGSTLIERRQNLDAIDGKDYTEYPIADNVTRFRVERIPDSGKRSVLVDITLALTPPGGEPVRLNTRVRVGGGK
ncbi:MAG: prepilin-type N-terminal cleavage/methylation domain-containing protein [Gammaproteobacteria bacterium]|nr:prepilin-type N-terminal cleavage/methylation domain-containing protein [Gammaproteobacteria bacterium]